MKRIISVLLSVLLLTTSVCVSAAVPSFLTDIVLNYTSDYTLSLSFDNPAAVVALLDEVEFSAEVNNYVDLESLLRTLLTFDGEMHLQSDISKDYKKTKLALIGKSSHNIDVNPNLNIGIKQGMGMWMDIDFSNEAAPVFDMVYSLPTMNKYIKMDSESIVDEAVLEMYKMMFTEEYMTSMQKMSVELFSKYAVITGSGNKYTIKMDNDGLIGYLNEVLLTSPVIMGSLMPNGEEYSPLDLPNFDGWQLLGEDGYELKVELKNGRIKTESAKIDISVDIKEIYKTVTGMEWEYESDGTVDFTAEMNANISKIGSTKVEFPELTDENTIYYKDMGHQYIEDEFEFSEYPRWYVSGYCEELPLINGEIYVPLRMTLEDAYYDVITIDYDDGNITATSDYFDGYKTIKLAIGSDKAFLGDEEYSIAKPVLVEGKTYVSNQLFAELFGWEFVSATHDILADEYYYSFFTE